MEADNRQAPNLLFAYPNRHFPAAPLLTQGRRTCADTDKHFISHTAPFQQRTQSFLLNWRGHVRHAPPLDGAASTEHERLASAAAPRASDRQDPGRPRAYLYGISGSLWRGRTRSFSKSKGDRSYHNNESNSKKEISSRQVLPSLYYYENFHSYTIKIIDLDTYVGYRYTDNFYFII